MHQRQAQTDSGAADLEAQKQQVKPGEMQWNPQQVPCVLSIHILRCCNVLLIVIPILIIYRENSSLVTHPFTLPKPRLVLYNSDVGFFLEGESKNIVQN